MTLKFRGVYRSKTQLSPANLPNSAVQYKEADDLASLSLQALIIQVPCLIVLGISVVLATLVNGEPPSNDAVQFFVLGCFVGFLLSVVQTLVQAMAYPRKAEMELWASISWAALFIYSTTPVSKRRFVFISLLPVSVLGFLPLLLWAFLWPTYSALLGIAFFGITSNAGNLVNVFHTLRQVPRGSMTVGSGFHSYWYPVAD